MKTGTCGSIRLVLGLILLAFSNYGFVINELVKLARDEEIHVSL